MKIPGDYIGRIAWASDAVEHSRLAVLHILLCFHLPALGRVSRTYFDPAADSIVLPVPTYTLHFTIPLRLPDIRD